MTSNMLLNFELVRAYSHVIICYKVVVLYTVIKNTLVRKKIVSDFLCCRVNFVVNPRSGVLFFRSPEKERLIAGYFVVEFAVTLM